MTQPTARVIGGKKYFWDGKVYPSQNEAAAAQATYEQDGFETCTTQGEGPFLFLVYTRRVVTPVGDATLN